MNILHRNSLCVLDYDQDSKRAKIEQRNYFKVGDKIETFSPSHSNIYFTVNKIYMKIMNWC
ncbi:MAG: U32 family peptidase C-terminal domain-containing protein [Faecalibacillus intestinalis]|uniref:U32 family peptidase C-terminal domain-containing protein n=1 Tax=Faecalibacillus intestinalis TaxID=1982626 RepID=UPI00399B6D50